MGSMDSCLAMPDKKTFTGGGLGPYLSHDLGY